ncbi:DUF4295 domain-containing protein [Blattabacterium cuenoti]|uniref:DUF4295 domain-containing protein n=1 Tax=Blattabacterium cuenoti TaxID=1653831 RepID=UPI00163CA70C|nr:DUF4295 domain-containing protein [Blattabacterium cuenoti]
MSKKIVNNKKKIESKKMVLAIRIVKKSKKYDSYAFEDKMITFEKVKNFFKIK